MMFLAIAAALASAPAMPNPAPAPEITVMGARLKKIRLNVDADGNGQIAKCEVAVSSGDAVLDSQACEATRNCAAQGIKGGEAMADCVDGRMVAFVKAQTAQHESKNETDAQN